MPLDQTKPDAWHRNHSGLALLGSWLVFLMAAVAMPKLAVAVLAGFFYLPPVALAIIRRFSWWRLRDSSIQLADDQLSQLDSSDCVVGTVQLADCYRVSYRMAGVDRAVYRVQQGRLGVRFRSDLLQAERIVNQIAGDQFWPPVWMRRYGAG